MWHGSADVKFQEIGKDTLEMKTYIGVVFYHIDVDGEVTRCLLHQIRTHWVGRMQHNRRLLTWTKIGSQILISKTPSHTELV